MRSISEFIMEQDTGISMSGTDNYVQAFCEWGVATSIAESYLEQAQYATFAMECGTYVYQEANIFKTIGKGIANAWKKFWTWLKSLFKNVGAKATDEKVTRMIDELLDIPDSTEITNVDIRIANIGIFATWLKEQLDAIDGVKIANQADEDAWGELANKFDNIANAADNYAKDGKIKALFGSDGKSYTSAKYGADKTFNDTEGNAKSLKKLTAGELKKMVAAIETKNTKKTVDDAIKKINKLEAELTKVIDSKSNAMKSAANTPDEALTRTQGGRVTGQAPIDNVSYTDNEGKTQTTTAAGSQVVYASDNPNNKDVMDTLSATAKLREMTAGEKRAIEAMKATTTGLTKAYDRALQDFKEAYAPTASAIKKAASDASSKGNKDQLKTLGYEESFYFV